MKRQRRQAPPPFAATNQRIVPNTDLMPAVHAFQTSADKQVETEQQREKQQKDAERLIGDQRPHRGRLSLLRRFFWRWPIHMPRLVDGKLPFRPFRPIPRHENQWFRAFKFNTIRYSLTRQQRQPRHEMLPSRWSERHKIRMPRDIAICLLYQ